MGVAYRHNKRCSSLLIIRKIEIRIIIKYNLICSDCLLLYNVVTLHIKEDTCQKFT